MGRACAGKKALRGAALLLCPGNSPLHRRGAHRGMPRVHQFEAVQLLRGGRSYLLQARHTHPGWLVLAVPATPCAIGQRARPQHGACSLFWWGWSCGPDAGRPSARWSAWAWRCCTTQRGEAPGGRGPPLPAGLTCTTAPWTRVCPQHGWECSVGRAQTKSGGCALDPLAGSVCVVCVLGVDGRPPTLELQSAGLFIEYCCLLRRHHFFHTPTRGAPSHAL